MTTPESAGSDEDLWHVEVAPDDVRTVTLDQLDEAFQNGFVSESTRVWQEGMACAVRLGELLGADEDEPPAAHAMYAPPPRSAPPPSRAAESAWPPVVAVSSAPQSSVPAPASTPAPPSMAPLAFDIPEYENPYARSSSGKGKWLLAALVVSAVGAVAAFQMRAQADTAPTPAVQSPLPPPEPPKGHAYDPGPPVKLGASKPPLELTVRDDSKANDAKSDSKKSLSTDAKKAFASGKPPKPAPRTHRAAPPRHAGSSAQFKLGKNGSKYDPLNGSL